MFCACAQLRSWLSRSDSLDIDIHQVQMGVVDKSFNTLYRVMVDYLSPIVI